MDTIDPTIKNLVKAIGEAETGGHKDPYNAKGASGEFGRYQFMPSTWKMWAKEKLGNENAPMSIENQNKVAYSKIKEWKDQGLNPAQIASKWNSGGADTYKTGGVGVNSLGVSYNVPEYVRKVSDNYRKFSNTLYQMDTTPSVTPTESTQTPTSIPKKITNVFGVTPFLEGIGQTIANVSGAQDTAIKANQDTIDMQSKLLETIKSNKAEGKDTSRLEKALQEITSHLEQNKDVATDVGTGGLSNKDVIGGAINTAALFAPGASAGASLATKVGAGAAAGYAMDVGNKMIADESGTPNDIIPTANDLVPGLGTIIGGALPIVSAALSKLVKDAPKWIVRSKLKGATDKNIDELLNRPTGTVKSLLEKSQKAVDSFDNRVDATLSHPLYENEIGNLDNLFNDIKSAFPNAEKLKSEKTIRNIIKTVAPKNSSIVDKIFDGVATLEEQNLLKKELYQATKKRFTDNPGLTFSKEIGAKLSDLLANNIKETVGPDFVDLFTEFSKEINIRNALEAAMEAGKANTKFNLYDIAAFMHGGLPAVMGEKIAKSPTVQIGAAKLIKKSGEVASKPAAKLAGKIAGKATISTAAKVTR